MTPRWGRGGSGTRAGVLGCDAVEVAAKTGEVNTGSAPEHGESSVGTDEPVASKRGQLPDGHAMPGDDKALPPVQTPHDFATFVPELTLGDVSGHAQQRSTGATDARSDPQCCDRTGDTPRLPADDASGVDARATCGYNIL